MTIFWGRRKATVSGNLQAIDDDSELIPALARETLEARRFGCVCSVVIDRQGRGSGFLVGNDLVMTCYHVLLDRTGKMVPPSQIKCRFNFFSDDQYDDDEHEWIGLSSDPSEAFVALNPTAPGDWSSSPHEKDYLSAFERPLLDYAILRLTTPVGEQAGRTPMDLELRPLGWISMKNTGNTGAGFSPRLSVFQFPERTTGAGFSQSSMQTSDSSSAGLTAKGLRGQYDASTRKGSSGSPVFDGVTLVGLHNAGQNNGRKADNRFVPIDRILLDLALYKRDIHDELLSSAPPPIVKLSSSGAIDSGMTERVKQAIKGRIKKAEALLDREAQNNLIQVKLRARDLPVYVNHVVCRDPEDEPARFLDRIIVGAAQVDAGPAPEFVARYLRGEDSTTSAWSIGGMTWPRANTPLEQVRSEFSEALESNGFSPRTLVILTASSLARRSPQEERAYMEILGEEFAKYVLKTNRGPAHAWQGLQALVVYQYGSNAALDITQIAPLWKEPPRYCGASLTLPKVTRDEIEPWRLNVNTAWSKCNTPIEFPAEFDPELEFYMAEVVAMLKAPLTNAVIALLNVETKASRL